MKGLISPKIIKSFCLCFLGNGPPLAQTLILKLAKVLQPRASDQRPTPSDLGPLAKAFSPEPPGLGFMSQTLWPKPYEPTPPAPNV